MAGQQAQFPRLDLAGAGVVSLALSLDLDWDEAGAAAFGDLVAGGQEYQRAVKYRRSSTDHLFVESVLPSNAPSLLDWDDDPFAGDVDLEALARALFDDEGDEDVEDQIEWVGVRVAYRSVDVPPGSVPAFLRRDGSLLRRLAALSVATPIACAADLAFVVDPPTLERSGFPLPLRLTSGRPTGLPFEEIRGLRGIGRWPEDDRPFELLLDRPMEEVVGLSLTFDLDGPLTEATPKLVLERLRRLALQLGLL